MEKSAFTQFERKPISGRGVNDSQESSWILVYFEQLNISEENIKFT